MFKMISKPARRVLSDCGSKARRWLSWTTAILLVASGVACSEDKPPSDNLVRNGSFEDTEGMIETDFGFKGEIPHWTGAVPLQAELVRDGVAEMPAADGSYWLDTGQTAANVVDISQQIDGLTAGDKLLLSFKAGQWKQPSAEPDESLSVYWGGELVTTIHPATVGGWDLIELELTSGEGDGSDILRFTGISDGSRDHQGAALDEIILTKIAG
ncbi:hypothetical protein KHP62_19765 [Rhodobacteraceae bacterium NNCM2]|nr:hypothetical protein [Coraliihabitans acroporae]